jgi:DNA invertase Pin-like site-specific DNA recombinase
MKNKIHQVAMYLRLSQDDHPATGGGSDAGIMRGNLKSESNSISNQREIIKAYIRGRDDMELYDVYVDDGYTGANFNRPDFRRMTGDIEAGHVDCVIVKDLSRFGRDYIEAGRYIQVMFPAKGIRFIAVTDHYDSVTADHSERSIIVPVKNFINDAYCRDISNKVRSQKRVKIRTGDCIGAFAVYGYAKDKHDRSRYVIDDHAARTVRDIFNWKLDGMSASAIAKRLNELGIQPPMAYKQSTGHNYKSGFAEGGSGLWATKMVLRILTTETYPGHMIQGKSEKINHKVDRTVVKGRAEWVKVENTHEAIIDPDGFRIVQNRLKSDSRVSPSGSGLNFFSGLLFCGGCGEHMIRRINRYKSKETVFHICSTNNRDGGCSRNAIGDRDLRGLVFAECVKYANLYLEQSFLLDEISRGEADFDDLSRHDGEIKRLRAERDRYYNLSSGLYDDLRDGILTKSEFTNLLNGYDTKVTQLDTAIANQELLVRDLLKHGIAAGSRLARFKECLNITEIDRRTLVHLVHRIAYHGDKRLEITFNFVNEYQAAVGLTGGLGDGAVSCGRGCDDA